VAITTCGSVTAAKYTGFIFKKCARIFVVIETRQRYLTAYYHFPKIYTFTCGKLQAPQLLQTSVRFIIIKTYAVIETKLTLLE
jgi:hypothetical protein